MTVGSKGARNNALDILVRPLATIDLVLGLPDEGLGEARRAPWISTMDRSEATHIQALVSVLKPKLIDKCLPLLVNDLRAETIFDP